MGLRIVAQFCTVPFAIVSAMATPLVFGETESVDYERLLEQCDPSTGCCKASVNHMRSIHAIPKTTEQCPSGYTPNTLRCINSYKWCEPIKGRCIAKDQAGKCTFWQPTPAP
jgi:hypothetical protein